MRIPLPGRLLAAAGVLALLAAVSSCGDSSGPGKAGPPAALEVVSGDAQAGMVGEELPKPLVVKVVDAAGYPVAGQVVNFRVVSGGGSVFAGASSTNAQGIAQERWTLGTKAGEPQKLEVRAVDNTTGQPIVFATFTATAKAGPPAELDHVGGDNQTGAAGAALAQPLAVKVTDKYVNPVPDATVAWAVKDGGGSVSAPTTKTDAEGVARVTWTLGSAVGVGHVTATVQGAGELSFAATATAGGAAAIQLVSGGGQTANAWTLLPQPIVVRAVDQFGNPVSGAVVSFETSAGGTFTPATATSNTQGQASSSWKLGGTPGTQTATISTPGAPALSVTATATAGPAAKVVIVSGDQQVGVAGQPLAQPLVVRVTDLAGNPVAGQTVSWTVPTSCGFVTPATSTSDASGLTQAQWTLGSSAAACGGGGVRAALASGQSATFTATITGGAAGSIGAPYNLTDFVGTIGTPSTLAAIVTDAAGNPVPGVTVTWSLASGTGSLSATSSATSTSGRASVTFTPGTVAGNNFIDASVAGVGTLRFLVWTKAGAPVRLVIRSGNEQSGPIGQALPDSISVRVEDQYGNGVYNEPVSFTTPAGGGHTERSRLTTDTLGILSARWIPGVIGANSATATWNGQSVTFGATGTTGAGKSIIIVSGNDQQIPAQTLPPFGYPLSQPLVVKVIDAQGNPVSGEAVSWFSPPSGSGSGVSDASGLVSFSTGVDGAGSGAKAITIRLGTGATAVAYAFIVGPGGNVACAPQSGGGQTGRVDTRLGAPVVVGCFGRSGPGTYTGIRTSNATQTGSGGSLAPVPGYRPPGYFWFYWIMPSQPGTYYLWVTGQSGTNFTTATATP